MYNIYIYIYIENTHLYTSTHVIITFFFKCMYYTKKKLEAGWWPALELQFPIVNMKSRPCFSEGSLWISCFLHVAYQAYPCRLQKNLHHLGAVHAVSMWRLGASATKSSGKVHRWPPTKDTSKNECILFEKPFFGQSDFTIHFGGVHWY